MRDMQISQVLGQMKAMAQRLGMNEAAAASAQPPPTIKNSAFAQLLKQKVDEVNAQQGHARDLRTAFERGDPQVALVDVMVASQKASLSFEAVKQVRNRLLSAYQEVMKMQV